MITRSVLCFLLLCIPISSATVTVEPALLNISPEQLYNIYTTNENCMHLADEINTAQITADMSKDTRSISRTLSLIHILYRCYQDLSSDCASLEKVRSAGRNLCTLMITQNLEVLPNTVDKDFFINKIPLIVYSIEYLYAMQYRYDAKEYLESIWPAINNHWSLEKTIKADYEAKEVMRDFAITRSYMKCLLLECMLQDTLTIDERLAIFVERLLPFIQEPWISNALFDTIIPTVAFQSSATNNNEETHYRLLVALEPFFLSKSATFRNTRSFYRQLIWSAQALKHYDDMLKWSLIAADRVDDSFRSYEADALHYISKKPGAPRPHEDTIAIMKEIGLIE